MATGKSKDPRAVSSHQLVIAPAAELDISGGFQWYKEKSLTAADGFRQEVIDAIEYVGREPLRQTQHNRGDRRWLLNRYPYTVVYTVDDYKVTIIAVAHNRRAPNYWRKSN